MEININANLRAEQKEPIARKGDLKKVFSQQKLHWAKTRAKSFGNMEVTKRFDCCLQTKLILLMLLGKLLKLRYFA